MRNSVYKDNHIEITESDNMFYIESFKNGMTPDKFKDIMGRLPLIKITSFFALRTALLKAPHAPILFGERKERIITEISGDGLKAYITLNIPEEEFKPENRKKLIEEVLGVLAKERIVYGVKSEVLNSGLVPFEKILIAEGVAAVNGEDAKIRRYEIEGPKPQVVDDGRVNHYELNLINHVKKGDWLGDRKDPTPGIPGKTVTGKVIKAIDGRMFPLLYDRLSVREEYKDGITTLYAKKSGAVLYKGDRVTVYDYMEVKGDVDFRTGNVDFEGFLSVKGTVKDNFIVAADRDVEIMGEYGVGAARKIESRDGNIYIRGGIAGKNKASIRCTRNLYVKYLKDVDVECDGTVYIGFYAMNANIRAKQIIIESNRGRIIGGNITAEISVEAAEIGNIAETRTAITVTGFDRGELKGQLDDIKEKLADAKLRMTKIKQLLHIYSNSNLLTKEQKETHSKIMDNYATLKDIIRELEINRRDYSRYLKTPGEGAVIVKSKIYPKVKIQIRGCVEEVNKESLGYTYYYINHELHKRI
jgi:uncharacterized protein (DUF342 family)